ncbi:chitin-binding type-2 domain-containing protein [Nephila pilipes]|uniref:Chitin-binding type-2 domain-containing protein n=1 Tax=Nephila pilipes TaxID=299642 RepID=A0A8X6Q683_NEPPI|nr:chitin-binding type-2 domain-containing protein [Nephila pilipes]
MQGSYIFTSIFLLLGLNAVVHSEPHNQNYLQRGGKSINWIWNNANTKSPDYIQRRRRYLLDENSEAWWNDMKMVWDPTGKRQTTENPLSPSEDIYFSGTGGHLSPFANLETLPTLANQTVGASMMVENPQSEDIDSSLIRELIIEEHHRPSKIELDSASQRLRDANENNAIVVETPSVTENSSIPDDLTPVEPIPSSEPESSAEKPMSLIEYVVPGVEHIQPHVEYVNDMDRFRESEVIYHQPRVEYVVPTVEFVEPEFEFFTTTRTSNVSEQIKTFSSEESIEEEFGSFGARVPLDLSIDRNRFLAVHDEEKMTSETQRMTKHKRMHRRNPEWGIPDVDYPTLEILPVVHFPCEEYTSGYYADVTARCQMFHICHENGQRSSFLCPIGTVFNQEYLVCDWWYNVNCEDSLSQHMGEDSYEAFGTSNKKSVAPASDEERDTESITFGKTKDNPSKHFLRFSKTNDASTTRDKTHLKKKSKSDQSNLSQKAVNYPIGYAILLREFMKNSPHYLPRYSKEVDESRTLESKPYDRSSEGHNQNEKISQEIDENAGNPVSDLKKQQKKQEFYGGSKPFSVSSEKRIHERVRTKRIKIKYFPPKSHGFSAIGNKIIPEPATYSSNNRQEERYISRPVPTNRDSSEESISAEKDRMADVEKNKTRLFINDPGSIPDDRNYYELKNITDDLEVIHLSQNVSAPKNQPVKKYDNRKYTSAASVINYEKEHFSSTDDAESEDFFNKKNQTNDEVIERNYTRGSRHPVSRLYKQKPTFLDRTQAKARKIVNKNSYTTFTESKTLKKSYIVDPEISLIELNKKFGERLYTKLPPFKVEKVTSYHTTPMFETERKVKRLIFPAITRQSFDSELITTTQITPVYIHTETLASSNNVSKNQLQPNKIGTLIVSKRTNTSKLRKTQQSRISTVTTSKNSNISISDKSQQKKISAVIISKSSINNKSVESDSLRQHQENDTIGVSKGNNFDIPIKLNGKLRPKKNGAFIIPKRNSDKSVKWGNLSQEKENNIGNITKSKETERNITDFDITSKFVNRISNLVSETKAPSEELSHNHSLAVNSTPREKVSYTVSVLIQPKQILNSNKSSDNKFLKNSKDSLRTLQPWLINSSSSSKLYNYEKITKNTTFQNRWSGILNKNTTKINNAHGGFIIVKKVRLKRNLQIPVASKYNQNPLSKNYLKNKLKTLHIEISNERR